MVDVANKLSVKREETVMGILNRWLTPLVNWDRFQRIEILGIDEIALKTGTQRLCGSSYNPLDRIKELRY